MELELVDERKYVVRLFFSVAENSLVVIKLIKSIHFSVKDSILCLELLCCFFDWFLDFDGS